MKFKLDAADKFFEALAIISVLANAVIIGVSYSSLPDVIPNHFGIDGTPNQYGSKSSLWIVVAVSVFIYMLTGIIAMFPESFNYPSQKEDKASQYKLGVKLMRSLRACILLFVTLVTVVMIHSTKTGTAKGTFWIIGIVPLILLGNLIWFFSRWKKIK
jgi:uncharacterized membrane protein